MPKLIPLSGKYGAGKHAIVDDDLFEELSQRTWHLLPRGYVACREPVTQNYILLHRQVMKASAGEEVDHRDHNPLNNRRENLRLCTHQQNCWNTPRVNKTGYRGVLVGHGGCHWTALIAINGKRHYLGSYPTPVDAALAYNAKAQEFFGEFAVLNDVEPLTDEQRSAFTRSQFQFRPLDRRNKSGYRGVGRLPSGSWYAEVIVERTKVFLGAFSDSQEAAYVYDQAATQLFGDKARLNLS